MALSRITAVWQGFTGAPGYTSFHFLAFGGGDETTSEVARVRSFFSELQPILPSSVSIQVQQETEILEEATGALINYGAAADPVAPVEGNGGTAYSAPSGGLVSWNTGTVVGNRRLRGRTFVVPLATASYQDDGTLTPVAIGALSDAAEALIGDGSGPRLHVWSRPTNGSGGVVGEVTGYRIPDLAAVLRSRRD